MFRLLGTLVLLMMVTAVPAAGHGAPTDPASRAVVCSPDQPTSSSAPCREALRAGLPSKEWDNIRLPNVAGRDAQVVPDGKLCSAGIKKYAGLDAPRADWPVTKLKGTSFTYRATIPHQGSFRFYVTRAGHTPTTPLRWANLDQFLSVPTPPLRGGAYAFTVQLPPGLSGRHMIYTVWQNTDTPDTYYSCTDVEIPAPPVATTSKIAPAPSTPRPVPVASSAEQPPSTTTRFGMSAVVGALGGLVILGGILLYRKKVL